MRKSLIFIGLFGLFFYMNAQNYYVASLNGEVYYQNKLLKKKDKVTPQGNIRFKSADSQVKLSGPGGLYTLSAHMGRPTGNEFLLTLSQELFPRVRPVSTVVPTLMVRMPYKNIAYLWSLGEREYYTILDPTLLPVNSTFAQNGGMIVWLYETPQGLAYNKARIQNESLLVLRAVDFNADYQNGARIPRALVISVTNLSLLDTIVDRQTTIEEVIALPVFSQEATANGNQILDELSHFSITKKKDFIKDLRFHIKKSGAKLQNEFLENFGYEEYIRQNYGQVYRLREILARDLKLPNISNIGN